MPATIALVDDDTNIATSLGIFLESEGYQIDAYPDGLAALEGLAEKPADLILLDIKMPRLDGLETLARLRKGAEPLASVPVIFLTSKADEADQLAGFSRGADDYVTKPFSQVLLLQRIKALLRRQNTVAMDTTEEEKIVRGPLGLDLARHICSWKGTPVNLTVTEFLLMKALVQHPGHVKTRDQLIDAAYGENVYIDDRIVDSHVKRLRRKFREIDSDFDEIETLYGAGYRYRFAS